MDRRGILFAPVRFHGHEWRAAGYRYTPTVVVIVEALLDHLFYRPQGHHYYFGDYHAPRYREAGFHLSYSWHTDSLGYDPIFAYQRWQHRDDRRWFDDYRDRYQFLRDHADARPPHKWSQMKQLKPGRDRDAGERVFATTLEGFKASGDGGTRLQKLAETQRGELAQRGRQLRDAAKDRQRIETRGAEPGRGGNERNAPVAASEQLPQTPVVGRSVSELPEAERPPERPEKGQPKKGKPDKRKPDRGKPDKR
jgi:hypothetical protein